MTPVSVIYCWNVWTDPPVKALVGAVPKPDMKECARK